HLTERNGPWGLLWPQNPVLHNPQESAIVFLRLIQHVASLWPDIIVRIQVGLLQTGFICATYRKATVQGAFKLFRHSLMASIWRRPSSARFSASPGDQLQIEWPRSNHGRRSAKRRARSGSG